MDILEELFFHVKPASNGGRHKP